MKNMLVAVVILSAVAACNVAEARRWFRRSTGGCPNGQCYAAPAMQPVATQPLAAANPAAAQPQAVVETPAAPATEAANVETNAAAPAPQSNVRTTRRLRWRLRR